MRTLADLVGRSAAWVQMAETGKRPLYRLDDLLHVVQALKVDLGTFLCTQAPGIPDPDHQRLLTHLREAFQGRDP